MTVKDDSLYVREIFPDSILEFFSPIQVLGFLPALAVTVIAETIAAALFSRGIKTSIKWVGYANALSLPIVWFVFPFLHLSAVWVFVLAETFAVIFEALFLHATNKKTGLSFKQASSASLAMNLSSIVAGALAVALIIGFIYLLS
ncbi:MAG: hypothetical protein HYZ49_07655 [Chloroflexi bacterium]|nr:hypothetical protein [Chloroflexota bacterium]